MKGTDQMKPSAFRKLLPLVIWLIGVLFPCVASGLDYVFFDSESPIHLLVYFLSLVIGMAICVFAITLTRFATWAKILMIFGSLLPIGFDAMLLIIFIRGQLGD